MPMNRTELSSREGWSLALALGIAGFIANGFPLASGWGLDFVLGGAVVFGALRVLTPAQIVVAASMAAARTIWLWNHPWAWLVWTAEAAVLALLSRQKSPVRHDVLFWILAGAPLLWLSYGQILKMDDASLLLVILKQGINGALNVTLGELIYTAALVTWGPRSCRRMPAVSIDSAILALMISVAVLPAVFWLKADAPQRERWLQSIAQGHLTEKYQQVEERLWNWREGHVVGLLANGPDAALHPDFTRFQTLKRKGQWVVDPARNDAPVYGPLAPGTEYRIQLLSSSSGTRELALAVPEILRGDFLRVGVLREGAVSQSLAPLPLEFALKSAENRLNEPTALLIAPDGSIGARTDLIRQAKKPDAPLAPWLLAAAASAPATGRTVEAQPPASFGVSPMNASRDAFFVTAWPTHAFPGWKIALVSRAADAVIEERLAQQRIMFALAGLIVFLTMIASILAERTRQQLDKVARSLTDLAVLGGERDQIHRALISEVADIGTRISLAGSLMQEQREALLASRRRLDAIVSYGGLVIYTLDSSNPLKPRLTSITPNVEKLFGFTVAQSLAHGVRSIMADDAIGPVRYAEWLTPGQVHTREYRVMHKQGHTVWVHDCLVAGEGEAVGFLLDISDRKAAAEALVQASKMESLGRMAAGVAHELNQPLNFINLASQNLYKRLRTSGSLEPSYVAEKLEKIMGQVKRAALIVGQVRTFGRSVTERPEVVAVRDVIADVETLLKGQLDLERVEFRCTECDPEIEVRIHPVRLSQVLINLAINARDSIMIKRRSDPEAGHIDIAVRKTGEWVEIVMDDDGTGIPPEQLGLLFEPFFTTKSPQEGTGLGLSVSYGIVAEAGGSISARNLPESDRQSGPHTGARFVIRLPAVGSEGQATPAQLTASQH